MKLRVTLDWTMEVEDAAAMSEEALVQQYMQVHLSQPLGNILPHMIVTDIQKIYPWEE